MANRGHYFTPHVIREVVDDNSFVPQIERHDVAIDKEYFPVMVEGMYQAVNAPAGTGGTAHIALIPGIDVCGKTGTAQNPHGKDNSVFICFAPKDNPVIAVAVYVEQGGFGATWAAPVASLIVEKYINRQIDPSRQYLVDNMKAGSLLNRY